MPVRRGLNSRALAPTRQCTCRHLRSSYCSSSSKLGAGTLYCSHQQQRQQRRDHLRLGHLAPARAAERASRALPPRWHLRPAPCGPPPTVPCWLRQATPHGWACWLGFRRLAAQQVLPRAAVRQTAVLHLAHLLPGDQAASLAKPRTLTGHAQPQRRQEEVQEFRSTGPVCSACCPLCLVRLQVRPQTPAHLVCRLSHQQQHPPRRQGPCGQQQPWSR